MKRVGRGILTLALFFTFVWTCRAAYLFRVWQIAQVWAELPKVSPPVESFFAPGTWGTTRHGSFADIVFLRVGMGNRAAPLIAALKPAHDLPAPPEEGCNWTNWRLNYPPRIAAPDLAPCYGEGESFTPTGEAHSLAVGKGVERGGAVWIDDRDTLYLAVYRTR